MRKRITGAEGTAVPPAEGWFDVAALAIVEVTSEDPAHPIEAAFQAEAGSGWRAATPGRQTIRLVFDQPQSIRRLRLVFREVAQSRTHEFTLHWSADGGQSQHEIVRQQYTFSPPATTEEIEDYHVELTHVTQLTLQMIPDISHGPLHAALTLFQIG